MPVNKEFVFYIFFKKLSLKSWGVGLGGDQSACLWEPLFDSFGSEELK